MAKRKSIKNQTSGSKLHGVKKNTARAVSTTKEDVSQATVRSKPAQKATNQASEFDLFDCTDETLVLLVIFPGKDCCFYGSIRLQCLGGSASIDGYKMVESSVSRPTMLTVCAPYKLGRPTVFSAHTLAEPKRGHNRLRYRLKEITSQFDRIMNLIGEKSAAVLLIERTLTNSATVIQELDDNIFVPRHFRSVRNSLWFERKYLFSCPTWRMYDETTLKDLDDMINHIKEKRSEGSRCTVITCAGKGAGKSTFVRYFANRNFEQDGRPVYILDADVGQSEFTPNGCLSLWKIDQPILDIPWTHQNVQFESCYFFGNIQPGHNREKYSLIFERLLNEFNTKSPPGSLLIINSLGWIEDAGKEIMENIISISRPSYAVLMPTTKKGGGEPFLFEVPSSVPRTVVVRTTLLPSSVGFSQVVPAVQGLWRLTPADNRRYTTIGYFAPVLPRPLLSSITDAKPFAVSFSDALFAIPEDVMLMKDEMFFGSINCQLVALCTTPDEPIECRRIMHMDSMPRLHILKTSSPLLRCIGFGIVRAIDLEKQMVYVISPLPEDQLARVSILARGTQMPLPFSFLTNQVTVGSKPYVSRIARHDGFLSELNRCFNYNPKFRRGFYPANA